MDGTCLLVNNKTGRQGVAKGAVTRLTSTTAAERSLDSTRGERTRGRKWEREGGDCSPLFSAVSISWRHEANVQSRTSTRSARHLALLALARHQVNNEAFHGVNSKDAEQWICLPAPWRTRSRHYPTELSRKHQQKRVALENIPNCGAAWDFQVKKQQLQRKQCTILSSSSLSLFQFPSNTLFVVWIVQIQKMLTATVLKTAAWWCGGYEGIRKKYSRRKQTLPVAFTFDEAFLGLIPTRCLFEGFSPSDPWSRGTLSRPRYTFHLV